MGSLGRCHSRPIEAEPELKPEGQGNRLCAVKELMGNWLMPESVRAAIAFCFKNYEPDTLSVSHLAENEQSKRAVQKYGFKCIKSGRYLAKLLNKEFDELHYIAYR